MDNADIGILSPIKIGYLSLLLFGAFVVNCSQRVATIESFLSNVCYAIRNSDRCQRFATLESLLSNARYALRDGDRGQQLAIIESLVFNARYWIIKGDFPLPFSYVFSVMLLLLLLLLFTLASFHATIDRSTRLKNMILFMIDNYLFFYH